MSSEDFVSHTIMRHFLNMGWHVIHYHPPGGQAAFSVYVNGDRIVPDMIALRANEIFISENKLDFNAEDVEKLTKYRSDAAAISKTLDYVEIQALGRGIPFQKPFVLQWGHGFASDAVIATNTSGILKVRVDDAGVVHISS